MELLAENKAAKETLEIHKREIERLESLLKEKMTELRRKELTIEKLSEENSNIISEKEKVDQNLSATKIESKKLTNLLDEKETKLQEISEILRKEQEKTFRLERKEFENYLSAKYKKFLIFARKKTR